MLWGGGDRGSGGRRPGGWGGRKAGWVTRLPRPQIIERCSAEVGRMKQTEELIRLTQRLRFHKVKVSPCPGPAPRPPQCGNKPEPPPAPPQALPLVSWSRRLELQGELTELGCRRGGVLFTSRPRFTPLCLLLFSDLLLITQPKRWVPGREGAQAGVGRRGAGGPAGSPILPLNCLFPGQRAAAAGSGLCPPLPRPGPAGSGPIWTPYVPPLPSQQPPGPPHPPATPSLLPVSRVAFRKHPGTLTWILRPRHPLPQSLSSTALVCPSEGPPGSNVTPPYVPTRSDMQRWLGAFPTPGPLPCSPDTVYEDCGECPLGDEGRKSEAKRGRWGKSYKGPRSHRVSPTPKQTVPRNCVQSLLHRSGLRHEVWSPGLCPGICTRALKVRGSFIYSFGELKKISLLIYLERKGRRKGRKRENPDVGLKPAN